MEYRLFSQAELLRINEKLSEIKALIEKLKGLKNSNEGRSEVNLRTRLMEKVSELLDTIDNNKETEEFESILNGVSSYLPALLRTHYLTERASRVGFDWECSRDILKKLEEELEEFKVEIKKGDRNGIEGELGDLLFVLVNVGRFLGVNSEAALNKSISKFIHRFQHIERSLTKRGEKLEDASLKEMDRLWDEAKTKEHEKTD